MRIEQLEQALHLMKKLWTEEKPTYKGKYYSIKEAKNEPKPVQKPHPPVWIGSLSGRRRISRVAAVHADVYNIRAWNPADYLKKMKSFKESCRLVGRSYDEVEKTIHVDFVIARERSDLDKKLAQYAKARGIPVDDSKKRTIHGTSDMCAETIRQYADLGVQGMILCFQPNKRIRDIQLFSEVAQQFR